MEARRYCSSDGADEFGTWLGSLADARAKAAVLVRIARVELGNLGDFKPVGNGVLELRIDHGPGLPRVLRPGGAGVDPASGRRRQAAPGA